MFGHIKWAQSSLMIHQALSSQKTPKNQLSSNSPKTIESRANLTTSNLGLLKKGSEMVYVGSVWWGK